MLWAVGPLASSGSKSPSSVATTRTPLAGFVPWFPTRMRYSVIPETSIGSSLSVTSKETAAKPSTSTVCVT